MSSAQTKFRRVRPKALGAAALGAALSIGLDVALTSHDAAFAAGAYAVTIPRGANIPIEFHAPPNARCELGTMNSPSSQRLTAISDARGIARYFVSTNGAARTGVLATLDCTSSKAHTLSGFTLTPGAAPPRAPVAPSRPLTRADPLTTARFGALPGTPAGFDVTTASALQLAQLHYPPRPDPVHDPTAFAMWREATTTPPIDAPTVALQVPSQPIPIPRALVGGARNSARKLKPQIAPSYDDPSVSLCGSLVTELNSPLNRIDGLWTVPYVNGYFGIQTSTTMLALNDLSIGTEQDAFNFSPFIFGSYYAWYQVGNNRYAFNVPIAPGDVVGADAGTAQGYNGVYPENEDIFEFFDEAQPHLYGAQVYAPSGDENYFAEWLEQRPESGLPLAQFTPVTISSATVQDDNLDAYDGGGNSIPWINQNQAPDGVQYSLQMTSDGTWSGNPMCFSWLNFYLDLAGPIMEFESPL